MEKKSVIAFLKKNGIKIKDNDKITYATKGENGIFWANPKKDVLISDWWIFLVDKKEKCLFLLLVPANSLREEDLRFRQHGRNSGLIQLLFKEEGGNIEDTSSKKNFTSWLYKRFYYSLPCMIQKILFGAPGTGKSHKIDNGLFKIDDGSAYGLKSVSNDCKFRTTFHPDYDYAQFVGSYKPKKDKDDSKRIVYEFVPQVFANAYAAAWKNLSQPVYLVIEEINRGNCAQIFGDIFQLLDRDENGYSSYEIEADADFAEWIKKQLDSSAAPKNNIPDGIRSGCKLSLPPNFNILATMNTSDQSLFPMDSAFKRRFDWEYVPIDFEGMDCADYQIEVGGEKPYSWQKFVESVNEKIFSITDSEDKQLGEYFIKLNPVDNNVITKERFLGKVMFYLWNEVCKDVHKQESFFREEDSGRYFTFQDLYKKDGDKKLIKFMEWITAKKEEMS